MDSWERMAEDRFEYLYGKMVIAFGGDPDNAYRMRTRAEWWEKMQYKPRRILEQAFTEVEDALAERLAEKDALLTDAVRFPTRVQMWACIKAVERKEEQRRRQQMGVTGAWCFKCANTGMIALYLVAPDRPTDPMCNTGGFATQAEMHEKNLERHGGAFVFRCGCAASDRMDKRLARYTKDLLADGCREPHNPSPAEKEALSRKHIAPAAERAARSMAGGNKNEPQG